MHASALRRLFVLGVFAIPSAAEASQDATPVQPTTPTPAPTPSPPPQPWLPPPEWVEQPTEPTTPTTPTTPVGPPPPPSTPTTPEPPPRLTLDPSPFPPPDQDIIFNARPVQNKRIQAIAHFGIGVDWMRQMPRLTLEELDRERFVAEQKITSAGSLMAWRAQVGIDLMFSRRWIFSLGSFAIGSAVGPSDRVVTAADGSPVEMRPWSTGIVTIGGPGFGFHLHKRRWTLAASSRVALSYLWMNATVVTGRTNNDVTLSGWVPSLRLDLAVCRRVGPLDNACVYVETRAYDTTSFNGGSAGLRWEFGG